MFLGLHFLPADDRGDAFTKALQFVQLLAGPGLMDLISSSADTIAAGYENIKDKVPEAVAASLQRTWLKDLLQVKFFFWPQENLLGIVGRDGGFPNVCADMVSSEVTFSDCSDQDYPESHWPDMVPLFSRVKTEVRAMSNEEVIMEMQDLYHGDIEYCRRSLVFQRIYHALDLDKWALDQTGRFECFRLSAVASDIDLVRASAMLRKKLWNS